MKGFEKQKGRKIELRTIVDDERGLVQIIRNLKDTSGFLVDSGNLGTMSKEDYVAFLEKELARMTSSGSLMDQLCPTFKR